MTILPLENAEGVRQPAPFVETPTAGKILNLARACCAYGKIGVVVGAPGTGKTAACAHLKREFCYWAVSLTPSTGSPAAGLRRVLDEISDGEATSYDHVHRDQRLRARLRQRLDDLGRALLIVDEAQHAQDGLLEELRCLHDDSAEGPGSKPRLGLLLMGNPTVLTRMNKDKDRFMHLISRIGFKPMKLPAPDPGDVQAICAQFGIMNRESLGLMENVSARGGGLRSVSNVLEIAAGTAGDAPISPAVLRQAIACVGV